MRASDAKLPWLAVGLMALLCGLAQLHPVNSLDLWWHMWAGELSLQQHCWSCVDHSTFTQDGWTFENAEWLFSVLAHGIWSLGGPALAAVAVALAAAICVLLAGSLALRLGRARPWLAVSVCALVVATVAMRFAPRPQALFLIYLPLALWLLEKPPDRARVILLCLFQLVWAHSHSSFVLLPALVAIRAAGWWLRGGNRQELLRHGSLVAGLGLLALLLGPQGLGVVGHVLGHGYSDAAAHNAEMRATTWDDMLPRQLGPSAWLALLLLLAVQRVATRRVRLDDLALAQMGAALLLTAVRFRAAFALLLLPLLVRRSAQSRPRWPRAERMAGALLALALVPATWQVASREQPWLLPGFGVWRAGSAHVVADMLAREDAEGHLFNGYGDGGYLIWRLAPRVQVAIDGRTPAFHTDEHFTLWRQAVRSKRTFDAMDARWGVDHVLLWRSEPLCPKLDRDERWRLVYLDESRALFTRRDGPFLPETDLLHLPACQQQGVSSGCPQSGEEAAGMWREASRLLELAPDASWPHVARLRLVACKPEVEPQLALAVARQALAGPLEAGDSLRAARVLAAAGELEEAAAVCARAWEPGEGAQLDLLQGRLLLQLGRAAEAAQVLERAVSTLDDNTMLADRLLLARALHQAGRPQEAARHAQQAAWAGDPEALQLLRTLLPELSEERAQEARIWLEL